MYEWYVEHRLLVGVLYAVVFLPLLADHVVTRVRAERRARAAGLARRGIPDGYLDLAQTAGWATLPLCYFLGAPWWLYVTGAIVATVAFLVEFERHGFGPRPELPS